MIGAFTLTDRCKALILHNQNPEFTIRPTMDWSEEISHCISLGSVEVLELGASILSLERKERC